MKYTDKERLEALMKKYGLNRKKVDRLVDISRFDLKKLIKQAGLSQSEVAEAAGISPSYISRIANKRLPITESTYTDITRAIELCKELQREREEMRYV